MTLTTDILRTWFGQFNTDYFGGELPMPRIVLSKARTRLGTMACRRVRKLFGWAYTDYTIRISVYYDCSEREYQQTLLHEMIHLYIVYKRIPDTSSHGKVFREQMRRLNSYGWHITISSSMRGKHVTAPADSARRRTYLVMALVLSTGEHILSVVNPRSARQLDKLAESTQRIVDHRWYMSQDPFFGDFPHVRTLRGRRVDKEVYNEKTAAMQPLVIK